MEYFALQTLGIRTLKKEVSSSTDCQLFKRIVNKLKKRCFLACSLHLALALEPRPRGSRRGKLS